MSDFSNALSIAASGMRTQTTRLSHISENIANSDTPGFRRKLTSFQPDRAFDATPGTVATGRVRLDQSALPMIYDPSHPMSDDSGHYEGSNVELVVEIADARQAQRSYEANMRIFEQVRQMSSSLNDLLRR